MTILITKERFEYELGTNPTGLFIYSFREKLGRAVVPEDYKLLQTRYLRRISHGDTTGLADVTDWAMANLRFTKNVRPWFFVSPASVLPADEVWVGFEVETGYTSREALTAGIGKLARCKQIVALDVEGSGSQPLEVTFFPVALRDMEKRGGPSRIIDMAATLTPAAHNSEHKIGTHFNFSTPTMRSRRRPTFSTISVSNAISRLSATERLLLFGRSRVYEREPIWQTTHVECKWFNTTYNKAVWARYCRVIRAFVAEVQAIESGQRTEERWDVFFRGLVGVENARTIREANRSRRAS